MRDEAVLQAVQAVQAATRERVTNLLHQLCRNFECQMAHVLEQRCHPQLKLQRVSHSESVPRCAVLPRLSAANGGSYTLWGDADRLRLHPVHGIPDSSAN